MPENILQLRGVFAAEALNIRSATVHTPCPLLVKVMGDEDKDKDRDSDPSNPIRTRVGRQPTPTNKTGYLSRFRPILPTNHLKQ